MEEPTDHARIVRFGVFEVDLRSGELHKLGLKIRLQEQPFQILAMLLEHPGEVVTREELQKKLWHDDTFVDFEHGLNKAINKIREALGDSADNPRFVETLHRRGYRFIYPVAAIYDRRSGVAPVSSSSPAVAAIYDRRPDSTSAARRYSRKSVALAGGALVAIAAILLALNVAGLRDRVLPQRAGPAPVQRTLTQLTFESGLSAEPTWSPDGRFMAFSSDRSGNFDVWVQTVGGGNAVQITKDPAHEWQPDWSPDGKLITFRSERDGGGLFVVSALGGNERKVSSFGYHPRWLPDGSLILFSSAFFEGVFTAPKLYVVALDGNPPRSVLPERLAEFMSVRSVGWYPDGQRVSFEGLHGLRGPGFWTVPIGEGKPARLGFTPEVERLLDIARIVNSSITGNRYLWGPSGRTLYLEATVRDVRNLWKVTVDPQTFRVVAGPERLTAGPGPDTNIALSADGKRLAFTARSERTRIWSLPFDAAKGKILGEGQLMSPAEVDAPEAVLSRDGKQLVFTARRADKWELWQRSLENGRETLLAADESRRRFLRWSPDGTRVVYERADPTGHKQVVVLAGGGTEEPVTSELVAAGDVYDWSLDGQWLLGECALGKPVRWSVCMLPLSAAPKAETQARVVASDPGHNLYQSNYSRDGRWIAINAEDATGVGISTIGVVPASGGQWTPITDGKSWDDKPRWSSDGKTIYFLSSRSGFMNVWGIRFDPVRGLPVGQPFRVTNFDDPGRMVQGLQEISLSEDRLLVPLTEVSGNIWMLENVEK